MAWAVSASLIVVTLLVVFTPPALHVPTMETPVGNERMSQFLERRLQNETVVSDAEVATTTTTTTITNYYFHPMQCVTENETLHLNWTNYTCVTAKMIIKDSDADFYVTCGAEAMLMKVEQTKTKTEMGAVLLGLVAKSAAYSIIPMLATALVFQAAFGEKKNDGYEEVPADGNQKSCCDSCKENIGKVFYFVLVTATICLNLYSTISATRRLLSEVAEMKGDLHFGGWCNFFLYLDYVRFEEVSEVIVLAAATWSDFIFSIFRLLHDCGLLVGGFVCSGCCTMKCFLCCKWCVLCACSCKCFCTLILLLLCIFPLIIVIYLLSFILIGWEILALAIVAVVYGFVFMLAFFLLLLVVYVLTLPIELVMVCLKKKESVQTPMDFYNGLLSRFSAEMSSTPKTDLKSILTSKLYAILIPGLCFLSMMLLAETSVPLVQSYALANEDYPKIMLLREKALAMPAWQLFFVQWAEQMAVPTQFLKVALVDGPLHIVEMAKDFIAVCNVEEFLAYVATLLDLGTTLEQFKKAMFALRLGGGLVAGPLWFFAQLAKYDTVK